MDYWGAFEQRNKETALSFHSSIEVDCISKPLDLELLHHCHIVTTPIRWASSKLVSMFPLIRQPRGRITPGHRPPLESCKVRSIQPLPILVAGSTLKTRHTLHEKKGGSTMRQTNVHKCNLFCPMNNSCPGCDNPNPTPCAVVDAQCVELHL